MNETRKIIPSKRSRRRRSKGKEGEENGNEDDEGEEGPATFSIDASAAWWMGPSTQEAGQPKAAGCRAVQC